MDESLPETGSLRILIADDSHSDRLILQAMLRRQGHQVVAASSGRQAVARYLEQQPHMVLLDVMMPDMDGIDAARRIKALAGEVMVPVIFLTSLSDAGALARCLEAGGDDFLSKPYNAVIIEAKIRAFDRMRLMQQTLSHQRDLIRERNEQLLQEQLTARRLFDNIAHTGCLDAPNIHYHASPLSIFNGDVLFACPRPAGGMHLLLGDFTGHGLPAAIGALPVAEIFYGMTAKGFSGSDVLREMNQKLRRILPTGMFCCAALVEADFRRQILRIWNGGLPDGYLLRATGGRVNLPSRHLPLGVLGPDRFAAAMTEVATAPGDTLLLLTDGILEASDGAGEMFGEQRLAGLLESAADAGTLLDRIRMGASEFTGTRLGQDDVTLFALDMVTREPMAEMPARGVQSALVGPAHWHCRYEIRDQTLGRFNPLPLLLHICMEVAGLRQYSGEIYTLLSELYTNALEHGILQLPSHWKNSADGFARYYAERERRLQQVRDHTVVFTLEHTPEGAGGTLTIDCEDSGPGFNSAEYAREPGTEAWGVEEEPAAQHYWGRGITLLSQLGRSVTYSEKGNRVQVVYHWDSMEPGAD